MSMKDLKVLFHKVYKVVEARQIQFIINYFAVILLSQKDSKQ